MCIRDRSLLYAFGTPVFFRTAYLNQNLGLGIFAFLAFALIWNPQRLVDWSARRRLFVAGLLGGLAFLCDYSGAILTGLLGLYAWWRSADEDGLWGGFRRSLWYLAGAIPGILILWQYQWASFGNPFYPPQHWMAPVEWMDVGYQGVGGLSLELLRMLLADPRFGLLFAMPMTLLALGTPWLIRQRRSALPAREFAVCVVTSVALILFFATVQYTRLQWNTGIRYLAPVFPFLFLALVPMLLALPRIITYGVAFASIALSWSMAMARSQGTVVENIQRVIIEGFQLPWLTVLTRMSAQYLPWFRGNVSALAAFVMGAILIWIIWRVEDPWRRSDASA